MNTPNTMLYPKDEPQIYYALCAGCGWESEETWEDHFADEAPGSCPECESSKIAMKEAN